MTYETLVLTVADRIATIELNRPEHLNSITSQMVDELVAVFAQTNDDPDVRVVVVTGRGKAYCAGADLSGGSGSLDAEERGWAEEIDEFRDGGGLITLNIFASTKPVIAAVNGVAAGLGATMLLPMDFIMAAESARFGFVFAKRGIVPEACSTWFLPKKVGLSKAAEWFYTGRMVSSAEALDAGLVRSVHPDDELLPAAYALAREIVDNTSPVAVGMIRQMLWRFASSDHPMDAHRVDSRLNYELGTTPDVVEGITSFLEKRPPRFPGTLPADAPASYPWWSEPTF
ncbi:enoyl-CoA hydratase-related protein [Aeromicrobium fastidiosum]|uniref:Enoyl-CoA hydratase n=1 Tax=Aeromicrobium fastidiosum TaxID=52699 RepID=A0A641AQY7_9ACTN|nr:enoyl-CoA hydratase-related protein [Aeromicrobium fastidiosum]KAA1380102.1 enoyl-CoA hydratase [Aeromicrobium fastidiosum]MBP2389633.1 enoyl-CoA hydratase/carnithine racemase [Aeromicrobium fastidiosum]